MSLGQMLCAPCFFQWVPSLLRASVSPSVKWGAYYCPTSPGAGCQLELVSAHPELPAVGTAPHGG